MIKKIYNFFIKMMNDFVTAHAASAAFFMFLSIFPILMIICSILPITPINIGLLFFFIEEKFPSWAKGFAFDIVRDVYNASPAIFSFSIIMALWACAKGMMALVTGFNSADGEIETRNYFLVRFWCIVYTLILMAVFMALITVIVFGRFIVDWLVTYLPALSLLLNFILSIRYIVLLALIVFIFCLMYYFMPKKRVSSILLKLPGALFAGVGWMVFTWGFSIYVEKIGNFSMYGSLTTIVLLLLWMFICMFLLLMGYEINVYLNYQIALFVVKRKYRVKKEKKKKEESIENQESS